MKKLVMSLALVLSFLAPTFASAAEAVSAQQVVASIQKIDEINAEISILRSQLRVAKIKKYAAITVGVTTGLLSAAAVLGRFTHLSEDGWKIQLSRDQFSTGLEITAVATGAAAAKSLYYANLKTEEINAFDAKLASLQNLLLAARAGIEEAGE